MEAHPLGVEETKAAVAAVKLLNGNATPIVLLVVRAKAGACGSRFVVIDPLCMLQANPAAERNSSEGLSDGLAKSFIHGRRVATPSQYGF